MKLLIATHNKGKIKELNALLSDAGVDVIGLAEAGVLFDVEETGTTFEENARLKAVQYAQATGLLTVADDSGLEIDALNGEPGVYTARYGGADLTQTERMELVLSKLVGLEGRERTARFRCVMVLADGAGNVLSVNAGVCQGEIAQAITGDGGFGYDPIFYLPEQGVTFAQLDKLTKNAISHRGQAVRAILPEIIRYRAEG
jgi:XTP/dITP diphosphohydrolase